MMLVFLWDDGKFLYGHIPRSHAFSGVFGYSGVFFGSMDDRISIFRLSFLPGAFSLSFLCIGHTWMYLSFSIFTGIIWLFIKPYVCDMGSLSLSGMGLPSWNLDS